LEILTAAKIGTVLLSVTQNLPFGRWIPMFQRMHSEHLQNYSKPRWGSDWLYEKTEKRNVSSWIGSVSQSQVWRKRGQWLTSIPNWGQCVPSKR